MQETPLPGEPFLVTFVSSYTHHILPIITNRPSVISSIISTDTNLGTTTVTVTETEANLATANATTTIKFLYYCYCYRYSYNNSYRKCYYNIL